MCLILKYLQHACDAIGWKEWCGVGISFHYNFSVHWNVRIFSFQLSHKKKKGEQVRKPEKICRTWGFCVHLIQSKSSKNEILLWVCLYHECTSQVKEPPPYILTVGHAIFLVRQSKNISNTLCTVDYMTNLFYVEPHK